MPRRRLTTAATWSLLGLAAAVSLLLPATPPGAHAAAAEPTGPPHPVFLVEDGALRAVELADGTRLDRFILPRSVSQLSWEGRRDRLRVLEPAGAAIRVHRLCDEDGDPSGVSETDLAAFRRRMAACLSDASALGHLIDVSDARRYSFVLEFERVVRDDQPGPDEHGELLLFERGRGAGNSWVVLEALDENGRRIGRPVLVSPHELQATSPPLHAPIGRDRTQPLGAVSIDLTRLALTELRRLRVSSPEPGRYGFSGGDVGADLRVMAVETGE